ncbi:MAG: GNAT family N-acetyltransferase [Candidatus Thermoplasmatota archaeon]|nr:GNAT family N-acetyltransferase [Candidatus Thermoplasmatota archaeon]
MICEDSGELVAIFPMWLRTFPDGLRVLEFMGTKGTDYLCPLVIGSKPGIYREIVLSIFDSDVCDVINFEEVPEHHSFVKWLRVFVLEERLERKETESSKCYPIPLPGSWEEYTYGLSRRTRNDLFYDRRFLKRNFSDAEFQFSCDVGRLSEHFSLHETRRKSVGGVGSYHLSEVRGFISAVATTWDKVGNLRLSMLLLNRVPAASILSCLWHSKIFAIHFGLNVSFAKYSPGSVLLGYCLEESINQKLNVFDLSRGYDTYKLKWNAVLKRNVQILLSKRKENLSHFEKTATPFYRSMGFSPSPL